MKDGEQLTSKSDKIKEPTRNNTVTGLYECHGSNIASKASNSRDIASLGQRIQVPSPLYLKTSTKRTQESTMIETLSQALLI